MVKSKVIVDLPSAETQRRKGPIEWVRSLFGAKLDLRSGKEELTVGAFSLVEGMEQAFSRAGVNNAISFIVDKKVIYLDTNDVDDDLVLVGKAAQESGVLDRPFKEMHLALTHKEAGLHTIIDVRIKNQVILGEEEMVIVLSSRIEDLRVRTGETAADYAERVKAFAQNPTALEPYKHSLDGLTHRVADALRATMVGARVREEAAVVEIIRPDAQQIGRFRQLEWGDDVHDPAYRPVPTHQRYGAYADPFYYYYYDPYYDFMSFMLVSSMMHSMYWHAPYVHVVDPSGHLLYSGADGGSFDTLGNSWAYGDSVHYSDAGVTVDNSIPDTGGGDYIVGGDAGQDFGGHDAGGSFGGDSSCSSASSCSSCSSGDGGGSSCGSSCGGSSCGSSCGGGCGGGSD
jgi:hypothetical protein